jgi:hypothetical protein
MLALLLAQVDTPISAPTSDIFSYSSTELILNVGLATLLGFIISYVYRATHKGLSYSQSFTQTILYVTMIVAIVMMVIGGNLARAFALVGALSIIRFRTVVKDTKDTSFVFAALALGMAAGTSSYELAGIGTVFMCGVAFLLHATNYGALHKSEFILRMAFDQKEDSSTYLKQINDLAKSSNLLHVEPSGDGELLKLTYDVQLKEDSSAQKLVQALKDIPGVSEVVLIVSKNDIDY